VGKLLQDEIDDLEEDFSSGIIDMHVTGDTLFITTDRSRPWIRTNRSAISFGETLSGGSGKTYRVTLTWKNLTNNISVAFKSGSDTAFTKTISSIAYVDGGRHSADIDIVFAPASGATGAKAGTLVLTSGNITVEVDLSGTAATVVVPTLSVSEDELNFSAMQGQTTDSQSFVVTGDNLTADATVSVSGTGFEISSDNSTFGTSAITLQRDGNGSVNATIFVKFTAGAANASGSVTVASGSISESVGVTGTVAELPSGYVKVDAITPLASGAHIDTGWTFPASGNTDTFGFKFNFEVVNTIMNCIILGSTNNGAAQGRNFVTYYNQTNTLVWTPYTDSTSFLLQVNGSGETDASKILPYTENGLELIHVEVGASRINSVTSRYIKDITGTAQKSDTPSFYSGAGFHLTIFNQSGNYANNNLRRLTIEEYDANEQAYVKTHEYVACKRLNDGAYGVYDKIGEDFLTASNIGEL
jgi:hypothetical protein